MVTYEVRLNNQFNAKGKATTDNDGEIEIKFTADIRNFNAGEIIANIALTGSQSASKHILINQISNQVDIQFFPEGGNLLENIPTKIAFKATNNNGLGENVSVTIKDTDGALITDSKAQHLGMGSFILNPQSGHTYNALVRFSDGSEKIFPIGGALPKGYALAVNNTDSTKIGVKIFISEGLVAKGDLKLIAQHNNKVMFSTQFSASKQLISTTIPKIKLPSGILTVTLLAENNQPVCERLLFIKNQLGKLNIDLMQTTKGKDAQEKKTFKSSLDGKPVSGSFSVSINNITKIKPDELNESNIFTDLLLTSDLAGYVEKPNYYFLTESIESKNNLDLLLLTQGWRRFIWKNFLQAKTIPITFLPEKFLQISGTVTTRTSKPAEKIKIQLFSSSKANGIISLDTFTDNQGRFNFDKLTFKDSTRFIIKADSEKDQKSLKITLDANPYQAITINKNSADLEINVNGSMLPYLQHNQNYTKELTRLGVLKSTVNLETVNITATRKTITESSNYNGPGVADVVIAEDDLVTAFDLPKWIEGRVMGVIIKDKMAYLSRSSVPDDIATPMLLIIDGAQVDPTILQEIPPQDVKSIEVLKNAALTAAYGVDKGVIIITTKKGTRSSYKNQIMPGIASYSPMGYYVSKEFYSPKYNPMQKDARDFRSTIFWNPNIISDKEGLASFEYQEPREKGNYRVVIEGIDAFGNLARKVYIDKVD
ncbi:TonB-dependent receptor [Pedobacter chinensis]|nr:TonB-dependent receptor [Pedobacter chinensis]